MCPSQEKDIFNSDLLCAKLAGRQTVAVKDVTTTFPGHEKGIQNSRVKNGAKIVLDPKIIMSP